MSSGSGSPRMETATTLAEAQDGAHEVAGAHGHHDMHSHHESKRVIRHRKSMDSSTHEMVDEEVFEAPPLTFRRTPSLHEHEHEETFYELFYDLVLVVVFMKLSYLKYDMTGPGIFCVLVIFLNFWSCWNVINIYITSHDTDDVIHRAYYMLHITMAFLMASYIQHPDHIFFSFDESAYYFAGASLGSRLVSIVAYFHLYMSNDFVRDNSTHIEDPKKKAGIKKEIAIKILSLVVSSALFITTMIIQHQDKTVPCIDDHHERRLTSIAHRMLGGSPGAGLETGCEGHDLTTEPNNMWTLVIWLLAIIIEQFALALTSIFMEPMPFCAEYCGERMQAWLMLTFGESVIALLYSAHDYEPSTIRSLVFSFVMIMLMCTAYFDITDADQFLHLFMLRDEKWEAFAYVMIQGIFSFCVFLVGVGLKCCIFAHEEVKKLHFVTGCSPDFVFGGAAADERRLGAWTYYELDKAVFKYFTVLTAAVSLVMFLSIAVAYLIPSAVPSRRKHFGRLGSLAIILLSNIIPLYLQGVSSDCIKYSSYGGNGASPPEGYTGPDGSPVGSRRLGAAAPVAGTPPAGKSDEAWKNTGMMSVSEAMMVLAIVVLGSFLVYMTALDVNRDETYEKLKDEAVKRSGNPNQKGLKKERGVMYALMRCCVVSAGVKQNEVQPEPATTTPLGTNNGDKKPWGVGEPLPPIDPAVVTTAEP